MARLQVRVRPNAPETRIISEKDGILTVAIAARAEAGKANLELVKFLTKKLKKQVIIRAGFRNRKKILEILE